MKHYPDIDPNPDFPKMEEAVLAYWKEARVFERSIENRAGGEEFIFYDGPPFANGLPHYGHLLTGYVKDLYARYHTMRGKRVERRFGWDCHGLPAEMGSEQELGISGRAAIQNFGIDKFNEHCRTSVMKYTKEWEEYVTRQARWVDFKNDYKTMDTPFMESVLWAFKQLYDKGLIYEAHRVMPYSWAAETPLSNFETKLDNSYREREDKAIYVGFKLKQRPDEAQDCEATFLIAWTTTPWTLPSNLALAVNRDIEYVSFTEGKYRYILAAGCDAKQPEMVKRTDDGSIPTRVFLKGGDLIGREYEPLFPYFKDHKNAFKILDGSSFVTDGDGTGIVHMAPGFGEDDQKCCEANGIELVVPVDGQGKYTDEIYDLPDLQLKGLNVICENVEKFKFGEANERIIRWLKDHKHLIGNPQQIKHNYPHCWRTDQPLIYRAMPSWYVEVTKFRDRAVEINKTIHWIPEHIRDGQMGHMLATAPDWSISRNRFWGTPIPVWRREDSGFGLQASEIKVFGSIAELEDFFDLEACLNTNLKPEARSLKPKITDLHRPFIDQLTVAKDGSKWRRVEDVFDCWFESGSMPFASRWPEIKNQMKKDDSGFWVLDSGFGFPADFITEYVGQTRGWFNTLIMLSTALFDKAPFKNCICHGVMLGESVKDPNTGKMVSQKLSKRLKNYPEPFKVFGEYGADALRWFLISSAVMRGNDLQIDKEGKFIRDVVRLAIKPIWNAYNFFCLYANADAIKAEFGVLSVECGSNQQHSTLRTPHSNIMDRYILAKCAQSVEIIRGALDAYDTPAACDAVTQFFEVLNNWYIRRNKERFWAEEKSVDKQAAYDTLHTVLTTMCRAAAPLLPLTLEEIYRGLTKKESVHLADFPMTSSSRGIAEAGISSNGTRSPTALGAAEDDEELIAQMDWVRDVCNAALAVRGKLNIRVRQPLSELTIVAKSIAVDGALMDIIQDELNVKKITTSLDFDNAATLKLSVNSAVLGKRLPARMKEILPASKKGEWKQAGGTVEICGEKLLSGEYTLQLEPKPEYQDRAQALSTNDALVILDTAITPELEAEGIARDLVRMIQEARKSAGLHVADRVTLGLEAANDVLAAAKAHSRYIEEQTLAKSFDIGKAADGFVVENKLGEHTVKITVAKCA